MEATCYNTIEHMNNRSYDKTSKSLKGMGFMKKTYKIEVDCANCAAKMEEAAKKTPGVAHAVVNFMTLKMNVEFAEGAQPDEVMPRVLENCKKVEDDCEIFF